MTSANPATWRLKTARACLLAGRDPFTGEIVLFQQTGPRSNGHLPEFYTFKNPEESNSNPEGIETNLSHPPSPKQPENITATHGAERR